MIILPLFPIILKQEWIMGHRHKIWLNKNNWIVVGPRCTVEINLIHDTRHLWTRLRTDGIKSMSRGFSGSKQVTNLPLQESCLNLFILDNRKWRTPYLKNDNGKLLVEVIIVTLDVVATVDLFTAGTIMTLILSIVDLYILHDYWIVVSFR